MVQFRFIRKNLIWSALILGLTFVAQLATAAPLTVDTKIGEALLGNSGDGTETQALAGILNVNVNTLLLDAKVTSPSAGQDDNGNWFIDVSPSTPGYFLLKFGIGGLSDITADTFFFSNIGELTKLVFTADQVQGIIEGCRNCNIGRLSHYTSFSPSAVPLPSGLALLATAVGLFGLIGWKRRDSARVAV
jgi:hypothetical protein